MLKHIFFYSTKTFFLFLTCLLFLAVTTFQAVAQTDEKSFNEKIKLLAEQFSISPASRHMQRLTNPALYQNLQEKLDSYPTKVIKHIRGKIITNRFLTREEFYAIEKKKAKEMTETMNLESQNTKESENQETKGTIVVARSKEQKGLPLCENGKTYQISTGRGRTSSKVTHNILFLEEGTPLPNNPAATFGKKIQIKYYSARAKHELHHIKGLEINCLPTRLRATESMYFKDEGFNALLDYDRDYYGKGYLHASITEMWEEK